MIAAKYNFCYNHKMITLNKVNVSSLKIGTRVFSLVTESLGTVVDISPTEAREGGRYIEVLWDNKNRSVQPQQNFEWVEVLV